MKKPGDASSFKVGQLAEMKSFLEGYRGAWFRCKIIEMDLKKNHLMLDYYDFEDDITEGKMYEVPPYARKWNPNKKQLMMRPHYPLVYHKSEMPPVNSISEVCVVIDGKWKVGDLGDWFADGCYWSARVVKVLSEDKVQIEFPMPPAGEGRDGEGGDDEIYEALFKDLRPYLDWSETEGWTLPIVDGQTSCGAQLVFPSKQEREGVEHPAAATGSPPNASSTTGTGVRVLGTSSAEGDTVRQNSKSVDTTFIEDVQTDDVEGEMHTSEAVDTTIFKDVKTEGDTEKDNLEVKMDDVESTDSTSSMRIQESDAAVDEDDIDYKVDLNIMHEETLEASILDLEELANKVKWIKSILNNHQPPRKDTTYWKFCQGRLD